VHVTKIKHESHPTPDFIRIPPGSLPSQLTTDNCFCAFHFVASRLRGFAASRLRVRPKLPAKPTRQCGDPARSRRRGQISGWKARATERAHTQTTVLGPTTAFVRFPSRLHRFVYSTTLLVLVLSPPWRTVLVLVLENRSGTNAHTRGQPSAARLTTDHRPLPFSGKTIRAMPVASDCRPQIAKIYPVRPPVPHMRRREYKLRRAF
jgi:hypothetical protein